MNITYTKISDIINECCEEDFQKVYKDLIESDPYGYCSEKNINYSPVIENYKELDIMIKTLKQDNIIDNHANVLNTIKKFKNNTLDLYSIQILNNDDKNILLKELLIHRKKHYIKLLLSTGLKLSYQTAIFSIYTYDMDIFKMFIHHLSNKEIYDYIIPYCFKLYNKKFLYEAIYHVAKIPSDIANIINEYVDKNNITIYYYLNNPYSTIFSFDYTGYICYNKEIDKISLSIKDKYIISDDNIFSILYKIKFNFFLNYDNLYDTKLFKKYIKFSLPN